MLPEKKKKPPGYVGRMLSVSEITVPEESFTINLNISAPWRTIKTILPDTAAFAGILTSLNSVDKYEAECHEPPPYRTRENESLAYAKSVLPLFFKVTSSTSQVSPCGGRYPTHVPAVFAEFMVTSIPSSEDRSGRCCLDCCRNRCCFYGSGRCRLRDCSPG